MENTLQKDTEIFYTREDLQKILHIGKNRACELMRQKDFPSIKLGNKYIIRKDKFDEFCDRWKNKEYEF